MTQRRRTPRLSPEDRRAQLLDAAQAELADQGFGLVTVEAIAQRAGVTRPVIYDLFGDLDRLLVAVIDRAVAADSTTLAAVLSGHRDEDNPGEFLVAAFGALLEAVRADPDNWRMLLMPPRGDSPELRRRIAGARRLITSQIRDLVGWGLSKLGLLEVDHDLLAKLIEAVCEDAARLTLAHPQRFSPERLSASGLDLVNLLTAVDPSRALPPEPEHAPIGPPAAVARAPADAPDGLPAGQRASQKKRVPQSERREQLLDVALRLIVEEGFGALSMEAIAREAEVNRVVIYRSFQNLPALLTALMEREDQRARDTLYGLLPREPADVSPAEVLYSAAGFLLGEVAAHPDSWRLALARPESAPRELQQIVNRRRAEWAKRMEPLVAYVLHDLKPDAPGHEIEAIARMLLTIGEELGRLTLEDPAFTPERLLRGIWRILAAVDLPGAGG